MPGRSFHQSRTETFSYNGGRRLWLGKMHRCAKWAAVVENCAELLHFIVSCTSLPTKPAVSTAPLCASAELRRTLEWCRSSGKLPTQNDSGSPRSQTALRRIMEYSSIYAGVCILFVYLTSLWTEKCACHRLPGRSFHQSRTETFSYNGGRRLWLGKMHRCAKWAAVVENCAELLHFIVSCTSLPTKPAVSTAPLCASAELRRTLEWCRSSGKLPTQNDSGSPRSQTALRRIMEYSSIYAGVCILFVYLTSLWTEKCACHRLPGRSFHQSRTETFSYNGGRRLWLGKMHRCAKWAAVVENRAELLHFIVSCTSPPTKPAVSTAPLCASAELRRTLEWCRSSGNRKTQARFGSGNLRIIHHEEKRVDLLLYICL